MRALLLLVYQQLEATQLKLWSYAVVAAPSRPDQMMGNYGILDIQHVLVARIGTCVQHQRNLGLCDAFIIAESYALRN